MDTALQDSFLQLLRLGIGTSPDATLPGEVDWFQLKALSERQGVSAVLLDALNAQSSRLTDRVPGELLMSWIGEVLYSFEYPYKQYVKAIASLAAFYHQHGYRMMVLKGYACSLDWPRPEHRPCGDIDIWQFGQYRQADAELSREKGIKIDDSHHHHTVFFWDRFMVENHYDFINVHAHRSSAQLEKLFKELGTDDSHFILLNGVKLYLPSANLHALFLVRHMASHFASVEINLRQVLDWAFFVRHHGRDVDWEWLTKILQQYQMDAFFHCINAICMEDLGFEAGIFPPVEADASLKGRVLADIIEPSFAEAEPRSVPKRLIFKFRRWQANAWKQRLCYKESRWTGFWYGIWAKMLKPSGF